MRNIPITPLMPETAACFVTGTIGKDTYSDIY